MQHGLSVFRLSVLTILGFALISCEKANENTPPSALTKETSNRLERLTLPERQVLAPNELFQAIYEEDLAKVQTIVEDSPHLLETHDEAYGDLPLATAMRLRLKEISLYLAQKTPNTSFSTPNAKNESLVFIAAQYGYDEVISILGTRSFDARAHLVGDVLYGIDHLDFSDADGRKAIQVAANRRVVQALDIEHHRGYLKIPYFGLYMHTDNHGHNFLHSAANDARNDVILYAAELFCNEGWAESDNPFAYIPGHAGNFISRVFQTYMPWEVDQFTRLENPFNLQDENKKTPFHLAAEKRLTDTLFALGACSLADYDLTDSDGNLAFHLFIQNLDKQERNLREKDKEGLNFFIHKQSAMRIFYVHTAHYINFENAAGNTPLHYAAELADPWLYNELKNKGGDIYRQNKEGRRPVDIFKQTQEQIK